MKVLNINKITTFVITYSFIINNHAFSSKNRLTGESFMSTSVTSKSLLVAGKSLSVIIFSPLLKESSLTLEIFELDKFVKEKYNCYILIIVTEMTVSKTNLLHRECTKIKSGPFFCVAHLCQILIKKHKANNLINFQTPFLEPFLELMSLCPGNAPFIA